MTTRQNERSVDPGSKTAGIDVEVVDIPVDISEASSQYSQPSTNMKKKEEKLFYAPSSGSSGSRDSATPAHDSEDENDDWEDVGMEDSNGVGSKMRLDGTTDTKEKSSQNATATKKTSKDNGIEEDDRLDFYDAEDYPHTCKRNTTLDYVRKSFKGFVQGRISHERSGRASSSPEKTNTPQEERLRDEDEARKAKDIKGAPLLFRLDNLPQTSTERQIAYERLAILLRQRWASSRNGNPPPTTADLVRQLAAEVHDDCTRFVPDFRGPVPLWPHESQGDEADEDVGLPVPWRRKVVMLFENEWMGWFVKEVARGEGVSVGIGAEGRNIFPSEYPKWERRFGKASGH